MVELGVSCKCNSSAYEAVVGRLIILRTASYRAKLANTGIARASPASTGCSDQYAITTFRWCGEGSHLGFRAFRVGSREEGRHSIGRVSDRVGESCIRDC
jgi:hypothetical protein